MGRSIKIIINSFSYTSILLIFVVFGQCGMYMKAGSKIIINNRDYKIKKRTNKKMIKNTEWFYSDREKNDRIVEQTENQTQKRNAKLEKEIGEWKKLLELGEIDETTYNEETNRLIEKERKKTERMKKF